MLPTRDVELVDKSAGLYSGNQAGAWSRSSLATSQGDFPAGVILALGWGVL